MEIIKVVVVRYLKEIYFDYKIYSENEFLNKIEEIYRALDFPSMTFDIEFTYVNGTIEGKYGSKI